MNIGEEQPSMSTTITKQSPLPLSLRGAMPVIAVLGLAAAFAIPGMRQSDIPAAHADVRRLPAALGTWRMDASETTDPQQLALSAGDLAALALDSYTLRQYTDARTGRHVQVLLEYRTLGRGAFNHRPEACYPAVGYVLSGRRTVPITYGGRTQSALTATADYRGEKGRSHQTLLYWFATGQRTEASFVRQQMEMALGRLQPARNGWGFVRLVTENAPGDEAQALAAEQDFARQASPALIDAMLPPR